MTNEQAAAFVAAQTAFFNCRVAAMQAENAQRFATSQSPAYTEDAFTALEREYESTIGHNACVELFRSCSP
jgi:hypothetical protein